MAKLIKKHQKGGTSFWKEQAPTIIDVPYPETYSTNNEPIVTGYRMDTKSIDDRALQVMEQLVQQGYTPIQAAGLVGVMYHESRVAPNSRNEKEFAGKGSTYTQNGGYGAGLLQFSGKDRKAQLLSTIGLPADTPIESLDIPTQLTIMQRIANGSDKMYFDALKRTNSIEDAAATAVVYTGNPKFSQNWSTHPTPMEARLVSKAFLSNGSAAATLYEDRLNKAQYYLDLYEQRH